MADSLSGIVTAEDARTIARAVAVLKRLSSDARMEAGGSGREQREVMLLAFVAGQCESASEQLSDLLISADVRLCGGWDALAEMGEARKADERERAAEREQLEAQA